MSKINWNIAELHATFGKLVQLPPVDVHKPEIAFSGRSNVGKSSLINKLLNRKSLARVSSTPGKTVTINFYSVGNQGGGEENNSIYIVDLPGYGYAKTSKDERARFGALTESYIKSGRISLFVQLIDFRHPPTADDLMMIEFLRQSGVPFVIALTKADKLKKKVRIEKKEAFVGANIIRPSDIIEFSSETGEGQSELRAVIEGVFD